MKHLESMHPGPGGCGGMYTANTMATAIEVLVWKLARAPLLTQQNQPKQERGY